MNPTAFGARAGLTAAALAAAIALASACSAQQATVPDAYGVEPASADVGVGDGVRIAVRIDGPSGPVTLPSDAVSSARLDMGPDGMAAMAAPLRPVAPQDGESLAWETDLVMAGRWALTLTADVPGAAEPVTGEVVFTAREGE